MPSAFATAAAGRRWSPVSIVTATPSAFSAATACAAFGRSASASAIQPTSVASSATPTSGLPRRLQPRRALHRRTRRPTRRRNAGEPSRIVRPPRSPVTPRPACTRTFATDGASAWRSPWRGRRSPGPAGASPRARGRSPGAAIRRRVNPGAARTATTAGLPAVSVPVLSTTSASIFSARSSAAAFLIRMPACAPRPTPTMSAVGVASPSAHGQAITSTAVARISAAAQSSSSRPLATSVTRRDRRGPPARSARKPGRRAAAPALSIPGRRRPAGRSPASSVA